ncbi:hypothetical protein JCM11641_004600 [Rhodosporidiobolus odoratus]
MSSIAAPVHPARRNGAFPPTVPSPPTRPPPPSLSSSSASSSFPSTRSKTSRLFGRVSRSVSPSSTSAGSISPSSISSPQPSSCPPATYNPLPAQARVPTRVTGPCEAPVRAKDRPRKLPRKPVPLAPEVERAERALEAALAMRRSQRRAQRRAQSEQSPQLEVVDGLWTSTCDERTDDLPKLDPPSSRRSSSSSSTSFNFYASICDSEDGEQAIRLSTSARRASIPSPAAIAANASLSPRLARIAAFTNAVSQLEPDAKGEDSLACALRTSFELPDLELPWWPTLFPTGTPLLDETPSPTPSSSSAFAVRVDTPPSPVSPSYPPAFGSRKSSSSSSSSSFSSSTDSTSILTTPLVSSALSLTPPLQPWGGIRKSLFRVEAANGTHIVIDTSPSLSSQASFSSASSSSPSLSYTSSSSSPRLHSLDLSGLRHKGGKWGDESELFVDALSTPLKEGTEGGEEKRLGYLPTVTADQGQGGKDKASSSSMSWVERDDEDEEVLVISLSPKLT